MARGRDILLSFRLKLANSRDGCGELTRTSQGTKTPLLWLCDACIPDTGCYLLSPCYRFKELELGLLALLLEKLLPSLTKAVKARALSRQAPSPGRHCNRQVSTSVRVTVGRETVQEKKMGPQLGCSEMESNINSDKEKPCKHGFLHKL